MKPPQLFRGRPWMLVAIGVGLATGAGLLTLAELDPSTNVILAWDALCATYLAAGAFTMSRSTSDDMRARAEKDDESRLTILILVLASTVVSVCAVGVELSLAQKAEGLWKFLRVGLAGGSVAASWGMVQLIFALHYAHGYYDRAPKGRKGDAGGLLFPGGEAPDYWDFLHFAVVIGVAAQTADVQITSKRTRRLATLHSLFAFVFNTVIVALTINLLASLVGGGS